MEHASTTQPAAGKYRPGRMDDAEFALYMTMVAEHQSRASFAVAVHPNDMRQAARYATDSLAVRALLTKHYQAAGADASTLAAVQATPLAELVGALLGTQPGSAAGNEQVGRS